MKKEVVKPTVRELQDEGICPTCYDRTHSGILYGDGKDTVFYKDEDVVCFFVSNPRAKGHICISSVEHFQDFSEAPDYLNEKIINFAKRIAVILREVYTCERTYLCTMCDGKINHYHVQLIPRYKDEKIGSGNFVKPRGVYVYEKEIFFKVKTLTEEFAENYKSNRFSA